MNGRDEFFKSMGLMFIGINLFNIFNLLFHFFMMRTLPPVDYGQLNTLMALFMFFTVPANTVQTTITKFISVLHANSQYQQARDFLRHFLLVMMSVALFFFLAIVVASSLLSSFLQISSRGGILLTGVILFFAMITPIPWGGLQGLQKFGLLTFNLVLHGGLKLFLGVLLVTGGWGVMGAIGSIAIAYFLTAILPLFMLNFLMKKENQDIEPQTGLRGGRPLNHSAAYRYFLPVGMTLFCFMTLTQVDLILVKHLFTPVEAGYYSIAQMVGRIILFLPLPVVMVMFPKVSLLNTQKKVTLPILTRSLIVAGVVCASGTLLSYLFPDRITEMLTGKAYPECLPLVRLFSVNMSFFSLTYILINYHLAIHQNLFLYPFILLTFLQIVAIVLFHETMIEVLTIVGGVAFCLMIINFYLAYRSGRKEKEGEDQHHV